MTLINVKLSNVLLPMKINIDPITVQVLLISIVNAHSLKLLNVKSLWIVMILLISLFKLWPNGTKTVTDKSIWMMVGLNKTLMPSITIVIMMKMVLPMLVKSNNVWLISKIKLEMITVQVMVILLAIVHSDRID
jgi:hypothetical protein